MSTLKETAERLRAEGFRKVRQSPNKRFSVWESSDGNKRLVLNHRNLVTSTYYKIHLPGGGHNFVQQPPEGE